MAEIKKIDHDRELDVVVAYLKETPDNPVETVEGPFEGHVLFHVDSVTNELVKITIYDFSVVRKKLIKELTFLFTRAVIKRWLQVIAETFTSARQHRPAYA